VCLLLLIADNFQLARGPLAGAIDAYDADKLQAAVRQLVTAGAEAIDLNFGPLARDAGEKTAFCVQAVRAVTDLPLLLDTANPLVVRAALACRAGGRMIVNGFSLEFSKRDHILPLAVEFGVEIIGYLIDARSQVPAELEARLSTALELYRAAREAGLPPERLIIDPVIVPLNWQDALQRNHDVIEIIRCLPDMLGHPAKTVAALSNLTSGAPPDARRTEVQCAFLPMLVEAGLSMLMLDWTRSAGVAAARICRRLVGRGVFSWAEFDRP